MKGYWHLTAGVISIALGYFLFRIDGQLACIMILVAMMPDLDIVLYSDYKYPKNDLGERELKFRRGIGGHRDGILHSSILAVILFFSFLEVTAQDMALCGYFSIALLSHLLMDFKNCKGTIRFFKGKLKLRGHKSTVWLLGNVLVLMFLIYTCFGAI